MNDQTLLIYYIAIFLVMTVYWSVSDPRGIKERYASYLKDNRLFFNSVAAFVIMIYVYLSLSLKLPFQNLLLVGLGFALFHIGMLIAIWAKACMGTNWGPPAYHNEQHQKKLIVNGPFSFTRNPIYLGLIFMMLGLGLSFSSFSILLVIIIFFGTRHIVQKEEKELKKQFGEKYSEYMKSVPRFL